MHILHLIEQQHSLQGRAHWVLRVQLEAIHIHQKQQQFGTLHMFQEVMPHANIHMGSLNETRQVGHTDLQH